MRPTETIDAWRARNWGQGRCCSACGDPIILADTEDWVSPLCCACWVEAGEPRTEPEVRT